MALDPRISLAVQVPDISNLFDSFRDSLERSKAIKRNDAAAPFEQQILEQSAASGAAQATDERSQRRLSNLYQTGQQLKPFLDRGDTQGAQNFMLNNISRLQSRIEAGEDIDITESMETLQKLQQGDVQGVQGDIAAVNGLFNQQAGRGQTAAQREMQGNLQIAQDPNSTQLEKDSALRALGAKGNISASATVQIAQDAALGEQVANQKAAEAEATETAKLKSKFKLLPEVERAVATAKASVNAIANNKKVAKSNSKALQIYEVGIRNLAESLGKTTQGPILSLFTGLTDSARTADGAKAIMLPVLKQMFRESGEGTFTDKDQEVLEGMIPTRKDSPETARAKLQMIDAVVQAKLGGDTGAVDLQNGAQQDQQTDLSLLSTEQLIAERKRLGGQ
jgi:hypothetical protein